MRQNDVFPSNFIKAADLQGKAVRLTIETCTMEDMGDDRKPVLHFVGKTKGLVMNKTNWGVLTNITGQDDSDYWGGWSIVLYAAKVSYQGRMVDGLRIDDRPGSSTAPVRQQPRAAAPPPVEPSEFASDFGGAAAGDPAAVGGPITDDDIPF